MRKRLLASLMTVLCLLALWSVGVREPVYADETRFSGTVQLMKEEEDVCVLQVEVENAGADFEGTVRLMMNATDGDGSCAYDTRLTLPQQGKKQFTLTIPSSAFAQNRLRGNGTLFFLDESDKTVGQVAFTNLFGNGSQAAFCVGILSDAYDKLTYLDMSGQNLDVGGNSLPISLVELSAENVADSLDGLYFLVIDQFDTSTLAPETITAIEDWTRNGGWLILGTGEWASQTLDAFDPDFLQIQYGPVSKRGQSNSYSVLAESGGYYYEYEQSGIDFKEMAVVELTDTAGDYDSSLLPGWIGSRDDGSISVFAVSLSDDEMQKMSATAVYDCYSETMTYANSFSQYYYSDTYSYLTERAFGEIDHANTEIDFTWLKVLIVLYVILIGPVLYLILAGAKKREWYWVAVPLCGVLFIGAVFVFGQSLRVNTTKVYSVTVQSADGKDTAAADTYFGAYHSGAKPWDFALTDSYTYAGPAFSYGSSYASTALTASDYHYRIGCGDGITVGLKPASNFENAYLFASGQKAGCGEIAMNDIVLNAGTQSGTVTNGTDCDFPYLALMSNEYLIVLEDVAAGQTIDIAKEAAAGTIFLQCDVSYVEDVYYNLVGYGYTGIDPELAATLFIGMNQTYGQIESDPGKVLALGTVWDYDKAAAGDCEEVSYGCLYSVSEQEVSDAAD